jgi:hypothetical protein
LNNAQSVVAATGRRIRDLPIHRNRDLRPVPSYGNGRCIEESLSVGDGVAAQRSATSARFQSLLRHAVDRLTVASSTRRNAYPR